VTVKKVRAARNHKDTAYPVRRIGLGLIAIAVCVALTACSVEEPMPVEIPPVKRRQEAKAPPMQALTPKSDEEPYSYAMSNRRDPFKPLIATTMPPEATSQETVYCPPTQEFELASLKLVAIVWGDMGRKAMLKAPNGRGYAVTEEMLVGRNCGRIRRIESTAVVIEETHRDAEGKVLKEEVVLRLREREG
jgi:Tfp pilus assembly protein PilP